MAGADRVGQPHPAAGHLAGLVADARGHPRVRALGRHRLPGPGRRARQPPRHPVVPDSPRSRRPSGSPRLRGREAAPSDGPPGTGRASWPASVRPAIVRRSTCASSGASTSGPSASGPDQQDAALARWLARLRLVPLTGPCDHTGLKIGYRPSLKLQHLVRIRRPTCTFPGCRQPARRCDIDHTVAFEHGGLTCLCNLGPLCRRHHRCKQAEGWSLSQPAPGESLWTTPSGRQYTTRSAPYPR